MPDSHNFHIGAVSGGQNNFGGHDNVFNQQNNGLDAAGVTRLLSRVRTNLGDFPDPEAAGRSLAEVEAAAPEELARPGRARAALEELLRYARPGTEALTALTALVTAIGGVTG
ncbi:hypothetical protein [Actinoplanes teichomyceticus]|uniref:Uncharacterized protein n=1 Tax=Actinoplanes teichomyceticus TaxID=1867 RepID=A0A561WLK3_ACTTI|nr:hypothetical protein [Actinoplanes teichomyceticus]TWG24747.1 hypothetical protein FHX34_1021307 [Actinoplanes teichomyceticus]GIF14589.1 hypothetical protein Ate01nite_46210 [Actinoplanes teichomyceticus]